MKRVLLTLAICAFIAIPAIAGPSVRVYTGAWSGPSSGGEFAALPGTGAGAWGWDPLQYYSNTTKNKYGQQGSFQTFCIEHSEVFSPGSTYNVTFSSSAWAGGTDNHDPGNGDPLSLGAAYLYHEFQKGTLSGYRYNGTDAERKADADLLQLTLWYLEDELGAPGDLKFFNLIPDATQFAANNGKYAVAVMSLWDANGGAAQDMLVCVPAPGAILLGGIGVGLVGWLRRRRTL